MIQRRLMNALNRVGNLLPHRTRRFILDDLKLSRVVRRLAKGGYSEATLPNGLSVTFSPLLHGHTVGTYEPAVVGAIEQTLKPGDTFYDVGANIGIFCLLASTIVGPGGRVLAFEPEDNNLACFRRTLENGPANIHLFPLAVGDKDGTMTFDRRGGAFSGRLVAQREAAFDAVEVQVRTLDGLIAEGLPPPDLIKIDVEGGEGSVLEGGMELLKRGTCAVLCEMHPGNSPDGVRRAFAALKAAGYGMTVLGGGDIAEPLVTQGTYHVLARHGAAERPR